MVIILFSSFFLVYEKTTEKQLMAYGQMALDGSALYVDSMMKSAKDLLDNLSLDPEVSKLLNYEDLSASGLLSGLRRLYKYEASSYFVDSIYVFNRRNNTVYVSSPHLHEAVYPISSFPDLEASSIMQSYSGIRNMEPLFRTYNTLFPSISSIPYISFIRYNALAKENESDVIMVNLRQDILSNLVTGEHKAKEGILFIADEKGTGTYVAGNSDIATEELQASLLEKFTKADANFVIKVKGRKYIVCSAEVLGGYAKLLLVADENVIASITRTKGYGNSIILLGLVFVAILSLCIFFLRRIWINSMNQIETLRKAEKEKQNLMEANRRSRILSFLHAEAIIEDTFLFKEYKGPILLVILALDHYASSILKRFEKASDRNILKKTILDKFQDICGTPNVLFSVYEEDEKCVVCVNSNISQDIIEKAKEVVEESLGISTTVLISNPLELEYIQQAYNQLCQSLSYRLLVGPGKTLTMAQLEEREATTYSIPEHTIKHLTEEILRIRTPEALALLTEILDNISFCSHRSAQSCLLNLSVALDDAFNRLQTNNGIEAPVSEALVYRVLKIESLQEVYTIVENMLKQMEQAILNSKNNRQAELLNEITKITRERYTEHDFSINTVAEELKMNASYLGRIFKKATGGTFSEFVLKKRMSEACHMLSSTEEPIESIVSLVGFNDTPYFYKLFKRLNGCTPVRYRQKNRCNKETKKEILRTEPPIQ